LVTEFQNQEAVFRAIGASLQTYYHAMGIEDSHRALVDHDHDAQNATHPPLTVRLHQANTVIAERLTLAVSDSQARAYVRALADGFFQAAAVLGDPRPDYLGPEGIEITERYTALLEARWLRLVPRLRPFVLAGTLDYPVVNMPGGPRPA
jgi:hypothetical protein